MLAINIQLSTFVLKIFICRCFWRSTMNVTTSRRNATDFWYQSTLYKLYTQYSVINKNNRVERDIGTCWVNEKKLFDLPFFPRSGPSIQQRGKQSSDNKALKGNSWDSNNAYQTILRQCKYYPSIARKMLSYITLKCERYQFCYILMISQASFWASCLKWD